jgi:RNA recognition motif-containing protein
MTMPEEELRGIFQRYGTVEEIFIMKDKATGQQKGCAFVRLALRSSCFAAIESLNEKFTFDVRVVRALTDPQGLSKPMVVRFAEKKKIDGAPLLQPTPFAFPPQPQPLYGAPVASYPRSSYPTPQMPMVPQPYNPMPPQQPLMPRAPYPQPPYGASPYGTAMQPMGAHMGAMGGNMEKREGAEVARLA